MTEDQLLEGVCECGEKGPIGDICDICGGVFSEGNSAYDEFDDEDLESYPKDMVQKDGEIEIVPLEEADEEEEDKFDD